MFEQVDLVENDDGSRAVMLLEAVDEFVMRRRLPVDVDGRAEVVENLIQRPESGVVTPAIHVSTLNIQHLLAKAFSNKFCDARLPRSAGVSYDGRVGGFSVRNRFEDAGKVVDLGVTMLNFSWDTPGTKDASIADHRCEGISVQSTKTYPGRFRKAPLIESCLHKMPFIRNQTHRILRSEAWELSGSSGDTVAFLTNICWWYRLMLVNNDCSQVVLQR